MKAALYQRLDAARQEVRPDWTPNRQQQVWNRIERARKLRAKLQTAAFSLSAVLLVLAGLLVWQEARLRSEDPVAITAVPAETQRPPLLLLEDGSTATALSPAARVEPIEVGQAGVVVRLAAGATRFEVVPRARPFRVLAGGVTVTVLGTVFVVDLEQDEVTVGVERGRVRVTWPGGERELGAGERAVVSQPRPADSARADKDKPSAAAPSGSSLEPSFAKSNARSWRTLAYDGEYAAAFDSMSAEGKSALRDEPGDLLLAADVARLSGHPDRSVAMLQGVVSRHAQDSRAPLAAFTLGRVLLDQLGRPHEAAQAFAAARRLAPAGALAQDAWAREVESWSRAGEAEFARARAEQFVHTYPRGRRLKAVRRFGGLD